MRAGLHSACNGPDGKRQPVDGPHTEGQGWKAPLPVEPEVPLLTLHPHSARLISLPHSADLVPLQSESHVLAAADLAAILFCRLITRGKRVCRLSLLSCLLCTASTWKQCIGQQRNKIRLSKACLSSEGQTGWQARSWWESTTCTPSRSV